MGLTVHRANSDIFQSRLAGDPVDSDPKPALFPRSGSTLTGVGTDGLIPHELATQYETLTVFTSLACSAEMNVFFSA